MAEFYDLPLDVFLGIGAMENNYFKHPRRSQSCRVEEEGGQGRHHPEAASGKSLGQQLLDRGCWQITRETLRYAHALYLTDKRDYSRLPERLRPPPTLELDLTDSHVLTAYAGLLLRDLLDHFHGDVDKAVGAYNGGPRNPNLQYAAGVEAVAAYVYAIYWSGLTSRERTGGDRYTRARGQHEKGIDGINRGSVGRRARMASSLSTAKIVFA